ncbi:hypothetical protein [Spirillospora sp. NPDC047279]|uniref:hypothetical protein n=1 Tax=Spirillospora sp. NPDC047279 TaxID=3155478 RepID=UPI0033D80A0D
MRVNAGFILFFLGGLAALVAGVIATSSAYNKCPGPGDRTVSAQCALDARAQSFSGLSVSLGGVGLMIASVGFQLGSLVAPRHAPTPVAFPASPAAGPPHPGPPQQPPYPQPR